MQTRLVIRVVLSGLTPLGSRERFSTTVLTSAEGYTQGMHLERAQFHARVRGLRAPWKVVQALEVAQL